VKAFAPAFVAGVLSAILYVIVSAFGLGLLFMFLPTLPLFWLGLSERSHMTAHACLIGTVILALFMPPLGLSMYILTLALPAWHISRQGMKSGNVRGITVWFPFTIIFSQLMCAFSFVLLAVALVYSSSEGGLPAILGPWLDTAAERFSSEMSSEEVQILKETLHKLSFLFFSLSAWIWALCLYVHAWVTQRELIRQKHPTRPHMSIDVLPPPNWMISLIIIAALASLIGSPSLAFWGQTSLIIYMLPYFMLGMALLHLRLKKSRFRVSLLFFIYFLLASALWPALFVGIYGLIYHLKLLNKYLSAGGTSSRS